MKPIILLFILSFGEIANSQVSDSLLQKVYEHELDYIGIFDNEILKQVHTSPRGRYLFLNNIVIDTLGTRITSFPKYLNGIVFFSATDKDDIQGAYILNGNNTSRCITGEILQYGFSNNLMIIKDFNYIYLVQFPQMSITKLLNLAESLSLNQKWIYENSMIMTDEFWINEDKLFFNYASCQAGCFNYTHYLFNKADKSIRNLKYIKSNKKNNLDEYTCLEFNEHEYRFILGFTSHSLDSNLIGRWLFNDTLKRELKLLSMNEAYMVKAPEGHFNYEPPDIAGYNYQNKILSGLNYRSNLDNKFSVIVPYKFSVNQELDMLRLFYDSLLSEREVRELGRYELSVLRNLIFAKHNYKFETEFWQAYFNLFEFYRSDEKRKSRQKDVEKLFTPSDRKNLGLIKRREKML